MKYQHRFLVYGTSLKPGDCIKYFVNDLSNYLLTIRLGSGT